MKVLCERAALVDALNIVGGVVPTRTPTPVLRCLKLTATEGLLVLAATDLQVSIRLGVEQVEVEQDNVTRLRFHLPKGFLRAAGRPGPEPALGRTRNEYVTQTRLVLNHEHGGLLCRLGPLGHSVLDSRE
ncbi:MAG: hypothetical protein IID33_13685 [Planctomycetes bacterium]|nr:hypothetical protein [Planctomycetota bacterium]